MQLWPFLFWLILLLPDYRLLSWSKLLPDHADRTDLGLKWGGSDSLPEKTKKKPLTSGESLIDLLKSIYPIVFKAIDCKKRRL
jgi:hypothetical protein